MLALQFGQALLIQGHVKSGTVFLGLGLASTQHGDKQKSQGNQQQQAGGEPQFDHFES